MATSLNREIRHQDYTGFIEHKTGKRIKTWRKNYCNYSTTIIFSDNTSLPLFEGGIFPDNPIYERIPESFCASCGEDAHVSQFDIFGRCDITLKKFWQKVRKVYWHRHSKGGL